MSTEKPTGTTRRQFLSTTGSLAAASVLAGVAVPRVHASEDNTIRLALIGCGGRGTGAVSDAIAAKRGPVKLVAMADLVEDRLRTSYENLQKKVTEGLDVSEDRKFFGFDAYQKAMDCLKPGDIAIFTTPMAFRWVHFGYAIDKNLNVFMEKPLTADGPTSRRMLALGEAAAKKNLKVGVGLMARHSRHLQQLCAKLHDGALGDIITMRAYRMAGDSGFTEKWPGSPSELLWQIREFHSFLWGSGGVFTDANIHLIDHVCWMKNDWPVKAQGLGGRHYHLSPQGNPYVDQNFDTYAVEYTFADGSKFFFDGRTMPGCAQFYSSYVHGPKGMAIVSRNGDGGGPCSIHKDQNPTRASQIWESVIPTEKDEKKINEWQDLLDAIRQDKPYSEVDYGVKASVVCSMGRKACHTGVEITFDDVLNSEDEYAPGVDKLTMDSPAFLTADANGKYPVPQPGLVTNREY